MTIQLFKRDFKKATSDINGKFYLPWDWDEMKQLEMMWPEDVPIEIELPQAS